MKCSHCGAEIPYVNGLCGPCWNIGIRNELLKGDTILVDRETFLRTMIKAHVPGEVGHDHAWELLAKGE